MPGPGGINSLLDLAQPPSGYVPGGGIYGGQANIPSDLLQPIQPTFANLPVAGMMGPGGAPMARQQMTAGVPGGGFWDENTIQSTPGGMAPGIGAGASVTERRPAVRPPLGVSWNGPSTDNWRLLPAGYNTPDYIMRNGHIIEKKWLTMPLAYVDYRGGEPTAQVSNLGGPGHNYPTSFGNSVSRGYFWPGQIEPWETEGGQGTT